LKYVIFQFYIDFENKDGRDAGKDVVTLEAERLKAQVDGIVLMRDDGGGLVYSS
jgi:carboxyl-terminal processing protease